MEYTKHNLLPYNVHIINTDKFKRVTIKINFKREVKKEEITARVFLLTLLYCSTKKYNTERLMEIKSEDLYGLAYSNTQVISGNYSIIQFTFSYLNKEYSEEYITKEVFEFINEILFNPNVIDKKFIEEEFEYVKRLGREAIAQIDENHRYLATTRLLEEMLPESSASYISEGYLNDLENLTSEKLYEYYLTMLKEEIIDIFVIGKVDSEEILENIKKYIPINYVKKEGITHYLTHEKTTKIKEVKEKKDINQSHLVIGVKLPEVNDFERDYVSAVYSYILGGGPDSLLFKVVREQNSLCYSISSSIARVANIMLIKSGISSKDYDLAVKLIKECIDNIAKGNFSEEDIDKAKVTYQSSIEELLDSPKSILNNYISMEYLKIESLEKRSENILKVKKEDVIKYAKKIKIDTIYLLEGSDTDEI